MICFVKKVVFMRKFTFNCLKVFINKLLLLDLFVLILLFQITKQLMLHFSRYKIAKLEEIMFLINQKYLNYLQKQEFANSRVWGCETSLTLRNILTSYENKSLSAIDYNISK